MERKIKKSEIPKIAKLVASCFTDYPVYKLYFPDEKKREKSIYYLMWYRLYVMQNYTVIVDDCIAFYSLKTPKDKNHSTIGLICNPLFLFGFLLHVSIKSYLKITEYQRVEKEISSKYFDETKDNYYHAACTLKQHRGLGFFLKGFRQSFPTSGRTFAETHVEKTFKLYERVGAHLLEKTEWNGITHYFFEFL